MQRYITISPAINPTTRVTIVMVIFKMTTKLVEKRAVVAVGRMSAVPVDRESVVTVSVVLVK